MNILDCFENLAGYQKKYEEAKNSILKTKLKLFEEGNVEKWNLDAGVKVSDKSNKK